MVDLTTTRWAGRFTPMASVLVVTGSPEREERQGEWHFVIYRTMELGKLLIPTFYLSAFFGYKLNGISLNVMHNI